jgi:hypothetical protein
MNKVYKNSSGQPIDPDYVPNYRKMNITPIGRPSVGAGQFVVSRGSTSNPRERAVPQTRTIPFAEVVVDDSFPIGAGPVPNVGNNIEHTWAGVDSDVVDDVGLNDDTLMIDNNDYIDLEAAAVGNVVRQIQEEEDLAAYQAMTSLDTKNLSEYSLLIFGEFYSTGTLEEIQKEVTDILYNQHELSEHASISLDDLTVVKKMNIKFGIFIGEE